MFRLSAASRALGRSREAIAAISAYSQRCMAGITLVVAIFATPKTPQRILGTGLFYVKKTGGPGACPARSDGPRERYLRDVVRIDARDQTLVRAGDRLLRLHNLNVIGYAGREAILRLGQRLIGEIEIA